jgi:hypothetical protein
VALRASVFGEGGQRKEWQQPRCNMRKVCSRTHFPGWKYLAMLAVGLQHYGIFLVSGAPWKRARPKNKRLSKVEHWPLLQPDLQLTQFGNALAYVAHTFKACNMLSLVCAGARHFDVRRTQNFSKISLAPKGLGFRNRRPSKPQDLQFLRSWMKRLS